MSKANRIFPLVLAMLPLLSAYSRAQQPAAPEQMPAQASATAVGTASGEGVLKLTTWSKDAAGQSTPTRSEIEFTPKFSIAYSEAVGGKRQLWVVLADQMPDTGALNDTDDRAEFLRMWCEREHAKYVAFVMEGNSAPGGSISCAGDGDKHNARVNVMNDLPSIKIDLSMNNGKRVEGNIGSGDGWESGDGEPTWSTTTGRYSFAVDLAAPSLRDRVLADGDENARGLAGANAAFKQYWKAAGSAKSMNDVLEWFTPERRTNAARQTAEWLAAGIDESRMHKIYSGSHSKPATITGSRAIGAAAVVTSEVPMDGEKMKCQTLLLQFQGVWKIGNENCWDTASQ